MKKSLKPDRQLVLYGEILGVLINTQMESNTSQPIFEEAYKGDYQKHPSLHLTERGIKRYDQHNPVPPIAGLIGRAHTILRAGATKFPRLDKEALSEPTRRLMQEFDDVLAQYQQLVAATADKDSAPNYEKIPQAYRNKIDYRIDRIVDALKACELVTEAAIPVIVTSDTGALKHVCVENKDGLGLFLFALPRIAQNQVNKNRVPEKFGVFLSENTGVAESTVKNEIHKLYYSRPLKAQTAANFMSMNEQLHKLFLANEHVLQLAALLSPTYQKEYLGILKDLGFETHVEKLENTFEASLVVESLAHDRDSKQLYELARQLSGCNPTDEPPHALLQKLEQSLADTQPLDIAAGEKVVLLKKYIQERQHVSTVSAPRWTGKNSIPGIG